MDNEAHKPPETAKASSRMDLTGYLARLPLIQIHSTYNYPAAGSVLVFSLMYGTLVWKSTRQPFPHLSASAEITVNDATL